MLTTPPAAAATADERKKGEENEFKTVKMQMSFYRCFTCIVHVAQALPSSILKHEKEKDDDDDYDNEEVATDERVRFKWN